MNIEKTKLKKTRKEKGLTQAEIAAKANISTRYYQSLEAGASDPTVKVALLIAEALDVENVKEIFPLPQSRKIEEKPDKNH